MSSSEEEKNFERLNKIAGKYKKNEVFNKFRSHQLAGDSSEDEDYESGSGSGTG